MVITPKASTSRFVAAAVATGGASGDAHVEAGAAPDGGCAPGGLTLPV